MLDPQARALLDLIAERGVPPTHTLSPAEARKLYRERRAYTQPATITMAEVRDLSAPAAHGSIGLRLYRPTTAATTPSPTIVYFHGGGWVIGDLDTHDVLCRELAHRSGCVVVAVDYRLAPEHRFPAAVDDSLAAARWVHEQAGTLGIDASRIALGGDSAGGNLATVTALGLRDGGGFKPRFQLLIYPGTDMRAVAPSHTSNGQGYMLTAETIGYFRGHYVPNERDWSDWRVSPLLHSELSKLPPALVITAGYDPLRDEGRQYADALSKAGVPTQYVCFERQIHGFITMGRVIDESNTAVALAAMAVQRALA
jgi:acetyl esterase